MEKNEFEKAIDDLEKIVQELEKGDLSLEEGIEKFKKGMELAEYCNKQLETAEKRITQIDEEGKETNFEVE